MIKCVSFLLLACGSLLVSCIKIQDRDSQTLTNAAESESLYSVEFHLSEVELKEDTAIIDGRLSNEPLSWQQFLIIPTFLNDEKVSSRPIFLKIGKLSLGQHRLYTFGQNIRFEIDDLISDGGSIETFPEFQTAMDGFPGKSGGALQLRVDQIRGELNIFLRGQNGGGGLPGPSGLPDLNGAPGKDSDIFVADYHPFICPCHGDECFQNPQALPYVSYPGAPGKKGIRGGTGGRGGNSGSVELINISPEIISHIHITQNFGKGGEGGSGGAGGIGGPPGRHNEFNRYCAPIGPGANGPSGDPGPRGENGRVE